MPNTHFEPAQDSGSATISPIDFFLATSAMSLGWGLRGTIGGGEIGAMIPGALLGMMLAELAGLSRRQSGLIAAASALGFGLGGAETYGQTIGLLRKESGAIWGLLGLTIKGGSWGIGAALLIWIAFHARQFNNRQRLTIFVLLISGTLAGWWLIDHPKLIYFSDPLNKPREEVWFGLITGPLIAFIYIGIQRSSKSIFKWALSGFIIGALGFGIGSLWFLIGFSLEHLWPHGPWWKLMEFTFGAILGAGFAVASQLLFFQKDLVENSNETSHFTFRNVILGLFLSSLTLLIQFNSPHRMPFLFLASVIMLIVMKYPALAWHVALSITIIGFVRDVMENHFNSIEGLASAVVVVLRNAIVVLAVEWLVSRSWFNNIWGVILLGLAGYCAWFLRDYFAGHLSITVVPLIFTIEILAVFWLGKIKMKKSFISTTVIKA